MKKFKDLVQGDVIYKILSDKAVYKLTLRDTPTVIAGDDLYLRTNVGDIVIPYDKLLCNSFYQEKYLSTQLYTVIIGGSENSIKTGPKLCKSWRDISENAILFAKDLTDGYLFDKIMPRRVFKSDDYFLIDIPELGDTIIFNRKHEKDKAIKWNNCYISYNIDNICQKLSDNVEYCENQVQLLEKETIKLQYLLDTYEDI